MEKQNPLSRKLLLILALFTILMCPLLYIGSVLSPSSLAILEPILCPSGMHLDQSTESISDLHGNVTAIYSECTDGNARVDVTGKMLIILFCIGIVGVALLVTWALISPNQAPDVPKITSE